MLCEKCHIRSATVHLSNEAQGGRQAVLNLCVHCATAALGEELVGSDVARLIAGLLARTGPAVAPPTAAPPAPAGQCPACGLTGTELEHLGKVGCAVCYQAFADHIGALLPTLHRGCEHHGGQPGTAAAPPDGAPTERDALLLELEQAVAEEAFERAAQIRDSLRRLE